jgi:acyl transferase domain-containing protein/SAM-dependent methyltransferase
MNTQRTSIAPDEHSIAIIGMQGRFPGAATVDELWKNLMAGREAVTTLTAEQMEGASVPKDIHELPNYVNKATLLEDVDKFDAEFFGFSPRDAELTDPQHRLFLECAWHSLEDAGYVPNRYKGDIGVFGGCELSGYLYLINRNLDRLGFLDGMQLMITNDKDYMATQVAYKLNLTGPAITVQTSCSTSLVATCLACQSLLEESCDIALAGGVTVKVPQRRGYLFAAGGILSPDGQCRPFDAAAQGTIVGSGVGLVVLKRLDKAIRDGDRIRAVIRGFGHNNDGANKVSYAAPSAEGQARAIETAFEMAGIAPRSVGYIEAHGTATMLGDPIEVSALSRVFRKSTDDTQFCSIGSVKANLGHLSCAAGVTGLIKAALVTETGEVPPNPHFNVPAPGIDFPTSPFFVNRDATQIQANDGPRRAGVSSFGVGGTNAHVLLEEPPKQVNSGPGRKRQLLVMSARSEAALNRVALAQARQIMTATSSELADIAYTAKTGRARFSHRRYVRVDADNPAGSALALLSYNAKKVRTFQSNGEDRPVVFMFSGQGSQYPDMGRGLFQAEPVFRRAFDRCCRAFRAETELDLKPIVFPTKNDRKCAADKLKQTQFTQPALFAVEYAMAQLWMSWGVRPRAMIGHSIGEYVAATLAGVMTLKDAVKLVARRGALMASCKPGAMLAIPKDEGSVRPLLPDDIAVAAVNAPGMTVVAGPTPAIKRLAKRLENKKITATLLRASHAFHSAMMDPILDAFIDVFEDVRLRAPTIDIYSNLTGSVLTATAATDPAYWAMHLRSTVRFADCVQCGLELQDAIFLEVGPGRALTNLAGLQLAGSDSVALSAMDSKAGPSDEADLATDALGQLWAQGADIDWHTYYRGETRRKVALPSYPFERDSYWVGGGEDPSMQAAATRKSMVGWAYLPDWVEAPTTGAHRLSKDARILIFSDKSSAAISLQNALAAQGVTAIKATAGKRFMQRKDGSFIVDPDEPEHMARLTERLRDDTNPITHVVFFWPLMLEDAETCVGTMQNAAIELAKTNGMAKLRMFSLTAQAQSARSDGTCSVAASATLAMAKTLGQEIPSLRVTTVDVAKDDQTATSADRLAGRLMDELQASEFSPSVAYIDGKRHRLSYTAKPLEPVDPSPLFKTNGVYVITGGLGNIGLTIARMLAEKYQAKLVLISRNGALPKANWKEMATGPDEFDKTAILARRLLELDRKGHVEVLKADTTDQHSLDQALSKTKEIFGEIDGVFHMAGNVKDGFGKLQELTPADLARQLDPKIGGARTLAKALQSHAPDFVILGSSLSSVLGGLNLGYYAAANQMLDSFAASRPTDARWISVNWDQWAFANQAHGEDAISPEDGAEALLRLAAIDANQIVISTKPLKARLAEWVEFTAVPGTTEASAGGHNRPNLTNPFEAPKTDMETILAGIWEDLLGLSPVGIHDKFFELGGHSLLAIEMTMRIEERFGYTPEVGQIFDAPTIAGLAPLIEKNIGKEQETSERIKVDPIPVAHDPDLKLEGAKKSFQDMYDGVTKQLDGSAFGAFAHFLNYGYAPNGAPVASKAELSDKMMNRNSVKLALEVIGTYPVDGKTLLDVGCGRGGTARTLAEFFEPAAVTGMDLSGAAVEFCRKTHTDPRLTFLQGDAEDLPFKDAQFDVVTNIESSHTYPAIQRFYASVMRVLKPGGAFLYTDLLPIGKLHQCLELLKDLGFVIEDERDITPNVLLSCDEIAAARLGAFGGDQDMSNFLAAPGSAVYETMKSGEWSYRIWRLMRPIK